MPLNMQSGYRRKPHELLSVITWSFQESLWISVTLFFNLLLREAGIRYGLIKNKGKKGRRGQVEGKFHPLYLTSSSRLCMVCRAELSSTLSSSSSYHSCGQVRLTFNQNLSKQTDVILTSTCRKQGYLWVTCDCDLQCIKNSSKRYSTSEEKEFATGGRREKSETTVYLNILSWSKWA